MGIPVYLSELSLTQYMPLCLPGASSLTHREMRSLAGNSVHAMVAGTFTAWVLANFKRVDVEPVSAQSEGAASSSVSNKVVHDLQR